MRVWGDEIGVLGTTFNLLKDRIFLVKLKKSTLTSEKVH